MLEFIIIAAITTGAALDVIAYISYYMKNKKE